MANLVILSTRLTIIDTKRIWGRKQYLWIISCIMKAEMFFILLICLAFFKNYYYCCLNVTILCDKLNAILYMYITTSAEEQYTFLCLCMSAWNMNINSSLLHDPHIIENLQCNPNKLTVFTLNCFVYQIYNFFEKLCRKSNHQLTFQT